MNQSWRILTIIVLLLAACEKGGEEIAAPNPQGEESAVESTESAEPAQAEPAAEPESPEAQPVEEPAPAVAEGTGGEAGFEGLRAGYFVSERFNVRFRLPGDWHQTTSDNEDSMMFEGPAGIQMIVANSQSIQLIDTNFAELNDRVSFDNVNILPDRTEAAPLNGLPGYRVEGDALLRGEDVPIYFISQAVSMPGEPLMATIFIPGENYFEHSDTMKAVLDSIEALDLRPE